MSFMRRHRWLALCILLNTAATAALVIPFADIWPSTDECVYAYQAKRILEGQVIYRDFFQPLLPGYLYLVAGWMQLFGEQLPVLRLLMILILWLTAILIFQLSRLMRVPPAFSLVPSLLFTVLKSRTGFELNHYSPNMLLEVAAAMAVARAFAGGGPAWLVGAGALAGADLLVTQHMGVHLALGLALAVLMLGGRRDPAIGIRAGLGRLAVGFIPIPLACLVYAALTSSVGAMFRNALVWPFAVYTRFDVQDLWYHWVRQVWSRLVSEPSLVGLYDLVLALIEAFAAPAAIVAAVLWLHRSRGTASPTVATTAVLAAAMYCGIYAAPNNLLARASLLGYILAYALSWRLYSFWRVSPRRRWAWAAFAIIFIGGPLVRGIAVARRVMRLHAETPSMPLSTAEGKLRLPEAWNAGQPSLLAYLQSSAPPHTSLYAATWSPWIYYLGGYRNPTPTDYLLPLFNTPEDVARTIAVLEEQRVRWVVLDSILQRNLDRRDGRFQALDYSIFETWQFFRYVRAHYLLRARCGDYSVYERRP